MTTALQDWLIGTLRTLSPETGEDGAFHRYEVWYHSDDAHERLRIFKIEDRDESLSELPLILASEIQRICDQHAATLPAGNSLRYGVSAFRGRDDTVAEATHYMVVLGTMVPNPGNSMASERGQLIRHNETLHTMMMQMVQGVAGRLSRDLEEERDARRRAEMRYSEVIAMREQMLDRQHERELEAAREARDAEQKQQLLGMVAQLAPVVLSRIAAPPSAGKQPPAISNDPAVLRDRAVGGIIRGLSAEEIGRIASSVRPETQAAFLELIDAYISQPPEPPPAAPRQDSPPHNGN